MMKSLEKKLWFSLIIMMSLTPLGILLPKLFKAGDAWGEWAPETLKEMLGFIPRELMRMSELWKAPLPDYSIAGGQPSLVLEIIGYVFSGFIGIVLVGITVYLVMRLTMKDEK